MNTNRNRYSVAPTYGAQRKAQAKRPPAQAAPQGPAAPQAPVGAYPQQPYFPVQNNAPASNPAYSPQYTQPQYPQQPAAPVQQGPYYAPNTPVAATSGAYGQPPNPAYGQQAPTQGVPTPSPVYPPKQKSQGSTGWLNIAVLVILPLLFIVTLFVPQPFLKWTFIGLSAITLLTMWFQQAFLSNARITLTFVYIALMTVSIVSLLAAPTPDRNANTGNPNNNNLGVQATNAPTPDPFTGGAVIGTIDPLAEEGLGADLGTPDVPVGESQAELRLKTFLSYWANNDRSAMLDYISTKWRADNGGSDVTAINTNFFNILGTRKLISFEITNAAGSDNDSMRTITIEAMVDKMNQTAVQKYKFNIAMVKEDDNWYVDPVSLKSSLPTETASPDTDTGNTGNTGTSPTATPPPATTDPKLIVYYNKEGGKYYHADADCKSVNEKYRPLTGFYFEALSTDAKLKKLTPCPDCNPPKK